MLLCFAFLAAGVITSWAQAQPKLVPIDQQKEISGKYYTVKIPAAVGDGTFQLQLMAGNSSLSTEKVKEIIEASVKTVLEKVTFK